MPDDPLSARFDARIPPTRPRFMVTLGVVAGMAVGVGSGCMMSPGRQHYTAHRTHRLEPRPNQPDEVSIAFGFDRATPTPAQPATAVATVTDQ